MIKLTNELSILAVSGDDAATFLQGQTTNDIKALSDQHWQFSAHLNHKGRLLAMFIIYKVDDNCYLLLTTRSITENIITRLKMFILRSKVQIKLTDYEVYFCCSHADSAATNIGDNDQIIGVDLDNKGNSLIIMAPEAKHQNDIHAHITNNPELWNRYLIEHQIVFISPALAGLFTPQHLQFSGVSYTKGCYTGQEIVARTHYLGKAKKSLDIINSAEEIAIGQEIKYDGDKSGIVLNRYHHHDHYVYLICS